MSKKMKVRIPVILEQEIEIDLKDNEWMEDVLKHYIDIKNWLYIDNAKVLSKRVVFLPKQEINVNKIISIKIEENWIEKENYNYDDIHYLHLKYINGNDEDERNFNRMVYAMTH